ncbi:hypothetical protein [Lacibacter cauensis]|uniref:hypothetical protein n=1 Tax=Lacibacter cauensis TaxID=510947 RepID=UPI001F54AECF|nr:hypothetical protein [Lacibacter cauensis]
MPTFSLAAEKALSVSSIWLSWLPVFSDCSESVSGLSCFLNSQLQADKTAAASKIYANFFIAARYKKQGEGFQAFTFF